jgi:hypothetical protein
MTTDSNEALLEVIVRFLLELGFHFSQKELNQQTFLPGISVDCGSLFIDKAKLLYPGDLLHEAGHLAVIPAEKRRRAQNDNFKKASEEMMAIAWSYAALVYLGLEPSVVFHEGGYKGWSASLIENFTQGRYIGVPMLQWIGLTVDEKRAKETGTRPYPHMLKWLLD